ncbi:hypothetical protein KHAB170019_14120 [Acinetobacter baumannii]|nr:hypothetical protein KHAB170019_14120 [Acinetobacter baumannii]
MISYQVLLSYENPKAIELGAAAWAAIISLVVGVAVALLMPVPSITQTNQNNNQSSANNELSNRENKTRVNGRIADNYGAGGTHRPNRSALQSL